MRKRSESQREKRKDVSSAQHLVGFSGKVLRRKLKPLRRSRSDKIREAALEQEYLDKCNNLSRCLKNHGNLLDVISQLRCCDGQNFCDSSLCQELQERYNNNISLIKFLLGNIGTTIDVLPNQIQVSLRGILHKDKKLRNKLEKVGFWFGELKGKMKGKVSNFSPSAAALLPRKKTPLVEEFFQIFVHGVKEDMPLVLTLWQDEPGRALREAVLKQCPSLPSYFILLSRGRKISDEHTLREQGLTQDCNIHVHFSLYGGMEKEKDPTDKTGEERNKKAPDKWKKAQVKQWINDVCEEYEIEEDDVSMLKTLSGAGLAKLTRQDFKERSPKQGDLIFTLWKELLNNKSTEEFGSDSAKSPTNSPRKDVEHKTNQAPDVSPGSAGPSPMNSPRNISPNDEKPVACAVPISDSSQTSDMVPKGPFGAVKNLDEYKNYLTIDEISSRSPKDGEVVSVKGVCSSGTHNAGGAGTLLIRNDPVKRNTFLELKVDIRVCPGSTSLSKHVLASILNVKLGEQLFVRGRVEGSHEGLKSMKKGFQILPVKIVVDSDHHAAFREDVKVKNSYLRQLSIPWPTECGIFPAEGSTQEPIFLNDSLEGTYGILFCYPNEQPEKIKESAVALKNSLSGDIFVGVDCSGTAIGSAMSRDEIIRKRDDLVRNVSGILPNVNEGVSICTSAAQAHELVEKKKNFVAAMYLLPKVQEAVENLGETEKIRILYRVHVEKGTSVVSFAKPEHTRAFTRVGTETKQMADYEDLFNRLESLANRNIPKRTATHINQEVEKASTYEISEMNYSIFNRVKFFETENKEFKVIIGDPKKIIPKDYIKRYSASFLNTDGGDILFGVDEDRATGFGYVVGVSMSLNDRKELLHESSEMICNLWPPVDSSQFFMKFIDVKCHASKNLLKYPKTYVDQQGKFVTFIFDNNSKVTKLLNLLKTKNIGHCAILRLQNCFGLLVKDITKLNVEHLLSELENERGKPPYFSMGVASFQEVEPALRDLCVVHLHLRTSPYPIHLTSPFHTFCLDKQGIVTEMEPKELLQRFSKRDYQYEPDKLLNAANGFEKENTSHVLICSPFCLPKKESDLYGLVVPEWALVFDFDQTPHQEGHLFNIYKPLHDRHQVERNLFLQTPLDGSVEINPKNGVCWCAVRGYENIHKTLSKEGHASWMMSHGHNVRTLIDDLVVQINPNQLVVVCLWDDGYEKLLASVDMLLQHFFSRWGPTKALFVCSNPSTKSAVLSSLIYPLEKAGFGNKIKRDSIFVALPHEMARHIGAELPPPYRSEDAFRVPRKLEIKHGEPRTFPDTLPQTIRQAIKGHLQIMYYDTGSNFKLKPEDEDKVREKFYCGSEISESGLSNGIAIEREKMKELKREMKSFLNDKRSHVCLTIVKAERGAGATTLCLQLLYEFHKHYVCARLLEFHDSLAANVEKINQHCQLPVILFVDSEMAYLPEFGDFKNDAESRNLNLKLLIVECDLFYGQQQMSNKKKQPIPYIVGTTAHKTIEISRELSPDEAGQLVEQFLKITDISEEKKGELRKLKERVANECSLRKFAFVSLTAFGKKFTGLPDYVEYRLAQANELQLQILEFLALIHVYTDFLFPVNALRRLAKREVVLLEGIFSNEDVRELLSPPSSAEKNVRRISFVEVADEVLKQQAKKREMVDPLYLKDVALRLAECALSDPRPNKKIERITRRLYVTSEYGSEKFSPLVRCIGEQNPDVARDMLHELSDIFDKGSGMWAHLLAHLAKYYMIQYEDFQRAIPLIEEAVHENKDDVLLHHIHGDLIRLHVQNLKEQVEFSLPQVIRYAIQSSHCFKTVKEKRPLMEHGYSSDALIRKVVMLAAVKSVGGTSFVDFLKDFLIKWRENKEPTNLTLEDKYVLSLVPESFANLRAVPISEYKAKLKGSLLENLGDLDALKALSEELKEVMKGTNDEAWTDKVVLKTLSLVYSLEFERKGLNPEEADERIKHLEQLLTVADFDEESMKIWIRCVRLGSKVPSLKEVRKKMDRWLKATGRRSPNALFYNYVVAILEALNDPKDTEKMKKANECIKELVRKRNLSRSKGVSQDPSLPVEWLHPKDGRHINSLESLLNHEDLVKDYLKGTTPRQQKPAGKEIINKALFEKNITKWDGVVDEITSDWKGIISLKNHISVSFVPVNVHPHMPNEGEKVKFCLAFNWTGPCAWYVVSEPGVAKARKAVSLSSPFLPVNPEDDDSDSEVSDKGDDDGLLPMVSESLHTQTVLKRKSVLAENDQDYQWIRYQDKEMEGIIYKLFPDKGFGYIYHPNFEATLYFHIRQIVPPVDSLQSIKLYSVVSFTVGMTSKGERAMNIKTVVDEESISRQLKECREQLVREESTTHPPEATRRNVRTVPTTLDDLLETRQEGYICELKCPPEHKSVHGWIRLELIQEKLFFQEFLSGIQKREIGNYRLEAKVQFTVNKNDKGFFAKNLYIKEHPEAKQVQCKCGWEDAVGKGIQEGYIGVLKKQYGFITQDFPRERNLTGIFFHESDLKGCTITQLNIGDRVRFRVEQNDKGCVAKQIDVLTLVVQAVQQGNFPSTSTSLGSRPFRERPNSDVGSFPSTSASVDPRMFQERPNPEVYGWSDRWSTGFNPNQMGFQPSISPGGRPPMRNSTLQGPFPEDYDGRPLWRRETRRK